MLCNLNGTASVKEWKGMKEAIGLCEMVLSVVNQTVIMEHCQPLGSVQLYCNAMPNEATSVM